MSRKAKKLQEKKMPESEVENIAKSQLKRLKRQHKIMEGSRLAYNEEMKQKLEKQKKQIIKLQEEKENLSTEDKVWISDEKRHYHTLSILIIQKQELELKIKKKRCELCETKKQLMKSTAEFLSTRKKLANRESGKFQMSNDSNKAISLLEVKLALANKELNKVMTNNSYLRIDIENLLKERNRFKELLDFLMKHLSEGKREMLDLIEQSTISYEQREEAQAKLHLLRSRSELVQEGHAQQLRELDRKLHHDIERAKFLTIKGQHRMMDQLEAKRELKLLAKAKSLEANIQRNKNVLNQIFEYYETEDLDIIISTFKKQEEENYALFNYVNEVNCEAENLYESAKIMKQKIITEKASQKEKDSVKSDDISALRQKVSTLETNTQNIQENRDEISKFQQKIFARANKLFVQCGCQESEFYHLLGTNNELSVHNLDVFFTVFEKHILSILELLFHKELDNSDNGLNHKHTTKIYSARKHKKSSH